MKSYNPMRWRHKITKNYTIYFGFIRGFVIGIHIPYAKIWDTYFGFVRVSFVPNNPNEATKIEWKK